MKTTKNNPFTKRKSIKSMFVGNNTVAYIVLLLVMIAAVSAFATAVFRFDQNTEVNNTTGLDVTTTNPTSTIEPSESTTSANNNVQQNNSNKVSGKFLCLLKNERFVIAFSTNGADFIPEYTAICAISEGVEAAAPTLGTFEDPSGNLLSNNTQNTKKLWYSFGEEEFVQYYSTVSNLTFHSCIYSEENNRSSLKTESFSFLGDSINTSDTEGISLTVQSAKYIYENIPSSATSFIFENLEEMNAFLGTNFDMDMLTIPTIFPDSKVYLDGKIFAVPKEISVDPTDDYVIDSFCPYKVASITESSANNHFAFGSIATSILTSNIDYIFNLFKDIKAYSESGEDITNYLIIKTAKTYADEELWALSENGYLKKGEYTFTLFIADNYGGYISKDITIYID